MKIGIAVSTVPSRKELLKNTVKMFKKYMPKDAIFIVIEDTNYWGVPVTKNRSVEALISHGCDHLFLFDDDTYPIAKDWEKPYIESPEPHLQYSFTTAPDHWVLTEQYRDDKLVAYDRSRGCMLYFDAKVIPIVGGEHNAFGKYGRAHENWSERVHKAGLTTNAYQDVPNSEELLYCADQDQANMSSVSPEFKQGWRYVDESKLPLYAEYRDQFSVPAMVSRRFDNGHRDRVWRALKNWFWDDLDYKVYEGHHIEGPFNRSLGLNLASSLAGNWAVGIFIDSDAYIDPKLLKKGVELAVREQKVVLPFTSVINISREKSLEMLDEQDGLLYKVGSADIEKIRTEPTSTQSLFVIVPRNVYEQVRGFDQRCVGWGAEDNIFYKAASIVSGEPLRLDGQVLHIWHPEANKSNRGRNNMRWLRYKKVVNRQQLERVRLLP